MDNREEGGACGSKHSLEGGKGMLQLAGVTVQPKVDEVHNIRGILQTNPEESERCGGQKFGHSLRRRHGIDVTVGAG